MKEKALIPHLFRTEFSKIVSVLCKTYGLTNIQLAEDIVSDTFLIATETWGLKGAPAFPSSWLYTVAKNKIKDHFKHNKVFNHKIKPELENSNNNIELEPNFSEGNIADSQLQMLFAVCNPIISSEAQIALALKVLCGFGVEEIANAFLSNKETINKRLARAKTTFRENKIELSPPSDKDLDNRIDNVLSIIYLLFNEGYYSSSSERTLKKDLCIEAMRLNYILLENPSTDLSKANALMALLCFHSSRFDERIDNNGELVLYDNQNKDNWDFELIEKGTYFLNKSAKGTVTKYHLEAVISFWHTKDDSVKDKWESILQLYNQLLQIEYSSIIALNRTYALSKANSKEEAITEALKIDLKNNHLYHSLLADLYEDIDPAKHLEHLEIALILVKTTVEKKVLEKKIEKAHSSNP